MQTLRRSGRSIFFSSNVIVHIERYLPTKMRLRCKLDKRFIHIIYIVGFKPSQCVKALKRFDKR